VVESTIYYGYCSENIKTGKMRRRCEIETSNALYIYLCVVCFRMFAPAMLRDAYVGYISSHLPGPHQGFLLPGTISEKLKETEPKEGVASMCGFSFKFLNRAKAALKMTPN